MPQAALQLTVHTGLQETWDFVQGLANWASCMPGYQECEIMNLQESIWTLRADLGAFERSVRLLAQVTGQVPPTLVQFTLTGMDENVQGHGRYTAMAAAQGGTAIDLELTLKMGGLMGPFLNVILEKALPGMLQELGDNLAAALGQGGGRGA